MFHFEYFKMIPQKICFFKNKNVMYLDQKFSPHLWSCEQKEVGSSVGRNNFCKVGLLSMIDVSLNRDHCRPRTCWLGYISILASGDPIGGAGISL